MENYKQDFLEKYVRLIVRMGVNIQKNQNLVINSPVDCAYFTRIAVKEAYEAGAREVFVRWSDDVCSRSTYLLAPEDIFDEFPKWNEIMLNGLSEGGAAILSISAADPEAMKGVDMNRILRAKKASDKALAPFRERTMGSHIQWCVTSVPSGAWAKKVFPNAENSNAAIQKLWDSLFSASRIDENDPVENWKKHSAEMRKNIETLENYNFKSLKFENSLGTDLEISLPENHVWAGGGDISKKGIPFLPNIPTEEVFTAPVKNSANGKVVGSKPLVYQGNVVENFEFSFKDGKVVDFYAGSNREVLEKLTTSGENMDFLGEIALVPFNSPISNMNILFYNTLYDENASCHLALGEAYPDCIKNGAAMSKEEREKAGINQSSGHHDFMIGTSDLNITGVTADGKTVPVFKEGNFAL